MNKKRKGRGRHAQRQSCYSRSFTEWPSLADRMKQGTRYKAQERMRVRKNAAHWKIVEDAQQRFDQIAEPDVVSWTSIISAYAKQGHGKEALRLFGQMQQKGVKPDKITFISILNAFTNPAALTEAKLMHARIIESKFDSDVAVGNALLKMYCKCGSLEDVRRAFDNMPTRNVISWTSLIAAYAQHGMLNVALQLLEQMSEEGAKPNFVTFISIFNALGSQCSLADVKLLHSHVANSGLESDIVVVNALINLYGKCGGLKESRELFDRTTERNAVSWNTMIAVYAQHGLAQLALDLFTVMEQENMKPDKITFVNVLNVCASAEALAIGRQMHARIIQSGFESDVVVATSLIKMYAKCRSLEDARKVFDKIPEPDVIAWSAMIAAYTQQGQGLSALKLFEEMQRQHVKPNEITFVALLDACASFGGLAEGKLIHSYLLKYGYESDLFVINALINMYSKCGCMDDACKIFEGMPKRNLVSWNVMIAGYSQSGQTKSALLLFEHMQREGFKPDKYTYVSIFDACANLAFLPDGKAIHSRIGSFKDDLDPEVGNALLNMYGKCGNIEEALNIFVRMFERDVVAWTSMISAYSQHGHGQFAIQLFAQMQEVGIELNDITIASILSGCSHSGLVDEGSHYFDSFSKRFHKLMTPVCYGCMVDLLGRAGHLAEAENLVCTMPFHPNVVIWMTLLASCRAFGDMERGKRAAKHILELDPQNSAAYVVLSDVHAAVCQ